MIQSTVHTAFVEFWDKMRGAKNAPWRLASCYWSAHSCSSREGIIFSYLQTFFGNVSWQSSVRSLAVTVLAASETRLPGAVSGERDGHRLDRSPLALWSLISVGPFGAAWDSSSIRWLDISTSFKYVWANIHFVCVREETSLGSGAVSRATVAYNKRSFSAGLRVTGKDNFRRNRIGWRIIRTRGFVWKGNKILFGRRCGAQIACACGKLPFDWPALTVFYMTLIILTECVCNHLSFGFLRCFGIERLIHRYDLIM